MSLLDGGPSAPEPVPWRRSPRVLGGVFVAVIHAVLIAFVLASLPRSVMSLPTPREMFYIFRPAAKPPRLPRKIEPSRTARPAAPLFRYAPLALPRAVTLPPQAGGLTLSLFACRPENLANLTPEQRARCGSGLAMGAFSGPIPGGGRELSRDAGRWRAAIATRNAPAAVPCTSTAQVSNGTVPGGTGPAAMVDLLCVVDKALGAAK